MKKKKKKKKIEFPEREKLFSLTEIVIRQISTSHSQLNSPPDVSGAEKAEFPNNQYSARHFHRLVEFFSHGHVLLHAFSSYFSLSFYINAHLETNFFFFINSQEVLKMFFFFLDFRNFIFFQFIAAVLCERKKGVWHSRLILLFSVLSSFPKDIYLFFKRFLLALINEMNSASKSVSTVFY